MPTHAELASKLLMDAAAFFRSIAHENAAVKKQMSENANAYEQVAALIAQRPTGSTGEKSHARMAGGLLSDAAGFFRTLGEKNQPIKDQMDQNARVFEQLAALVEKDPLGKMD